MTEEIKEILYLENYISKYKGDEKSIINGNRLTTPAMLDYLEVKSILNYITNLQNENEKLKETLQTDKLMKAFMVEHNRNEKAVELIRKALIESDITGNGTLDLSNLLNILQGGDE